MKINIRDHSDDSDWVVVELLYNDGNVSNDAVTTRAFDKMSEAINSLVFGGRPITPSSVYVTTTAHPGNSIGHTYNRTSATENGALTRCMRDILAYRNDLMKNQIESHIAVTPFKGRIEVKLFNPTDNAVHQMMWIREVEVTD